MTDIPPPPHPPFRQEAPPTDPWALPPALRRRDDFDIGIVLSRGWDVLKANYGMLLAVVGINLGIGIGSGMVSNLVGVVGKTASPTGQFAGTAVSLILGIFLDIPMRAGVAFAGVKAARGRALVPMDAFLGFTRYWNIVAIGVLTGLIVAGCVAPFACAIGMGVAMAGAWGGGASGLGAAGIVALVLAALVMIVITIIVATRLSLASMVSLDPAWSRLDPIECLKASWRLTAPVWGRMVLVNVIVGGIVVGSVLLLCIGLLLLGMPLAMSIGGVVYATIAAVYLQTNCPRCGYDLTGLSGEFCPECGGSVSGAGEPEGLPAE